MSDFTDFCTQIADWANRQDWSPTLVTSFVRDAESKFNAELRVDRMINTDDAIIASRCAPLPPDWLEMDFVSVANPNAANGWMPIRYMARDQFFNTVDSGVRVPSGRQGRSYGFYTLEGRQIYFGGYPDAINGIPYRISYYGEVPVFSDTQDSWVYTKYPSLYRYAALINADLHAVGEEQQAGAMKQLAEDMIKKLNDVHLRAKASGSRLTRTRVRRF
jgi:hypothetical protein